MTIGEFFCLYKKNSIELRRIREEYAYMSDITGVSYKDSPSHNSLPTSSVEKTVNRMLTQEQKIDDLKSYFKKSSYLLSKLDKLDKSIVIEYYIKERRSGDDFKLLLNELKISKSSLYRHLKKLNTTYHSV